MTSDLLFKASRLSRSDATLFWRAATIVRHRRDVLDNGDLQARCLNRTHRRFPTRAWTFHAHFHFFQTKAHRLAASVLRHHLRGVCGTFARALEPHFAGARPTNHMTYLIGDADDR